MSIEKLKEKLAVLQDVLDQATESGEPYSAYDDVPVDGGDLTEAVCTAYYETLRAIQGDTLRAVHDKLKDGLQHADASGLRWGNRLQRVDVVNAISLTAALADGEQAESEIDHAQGILYELERLLVRV